MNLISFDLEVGTLGNSASKLSYLFCGLIAGTTSRTITAPLDRLKVYLQTYRGIIDKSNELHNVNTNTTTNTTGPGLIRRYFNTIKQANIDIYRAGGIRAFYKGNGINVLKIIPESGTKFFVFEWTKSLIKSKDGPLTIKERFMAGGIAGMFSQFAIYPFEIIKVRFMSSATSTINNKKSSFIYTIKNVYTTNGVRGFYKGLNMSLLGIFPFAAIDLSLFETLKYHYLASHNKKENETPKISVILGCGVVSGTVGAVTVYPISLIRTR